MSNLSMTTFIKKLFLKIHHIQKDISSKNPFQVRFVKINCALADHSNLLDLKTPLGQKKQNLFLFCIVFGGCENGTNEDATFEKTEIFAFNFQLRSFEITILKSL